MAAAAPAAPSTPAGDAQEAPLPCTHPPTTSHPNAATQTPIDSKCTDENQAEIISEGAGVDKGEQRIRIIQ
eukprot:5616487-Karenia_brevis.AAC.1